MAIVLNETPPSASRTTPASSAPKFPAALASAFALQFGQVYLNEYAVPATQRSAELAQFLPPGEAAAMAADGAGSLQLQSEQVVRIDVRDSHRAVVTLLALVNGKLMDLGVPLYANGGGMVVSGEPAWLPAPPRTAPPSPSSPAASDSATQATLMSQLPGFFRAFASGDQATLSRFDAPGSTVTGLAHQVAFVSLSSITVPPGGTTRHIQAAVVWRIPGQQAAGVPVTRMEMTYALTVIKLHGTWFVQRIGPSNLAGESP